MVYVPPHAPTTSVLLNPSGARVVYVLIPYKQKVGNCYIPAIRPRIIRKERSRVMNKSFSVNILALTRFGSKG